MSRMRLGPGVGGGAGSRMGGESTEAGLCHEAKEVSAKARARSSVKAPAMISVASAGRAARRQKVTRFERVSAARSGASPEGRRAEGRPAKRRPDRERG